MSSTIMPNWLLQRAHLTPNRLAILFKGETWTYKELYNESMELARRFYHLGIRKGDHVSFLLENRPNTIFFIHAMHFLGAIMVPLNKRLSAEEIDFQQKDSNADYMVFDSKNVEKAKSITSIKKISLEDIDAFSNEPFPYAKEIGLDEMHTIIYTSGTTGKPKGVMLSYSNHWWSAAGSALNLGLSPDDRWLCAVPLFHVSGLSIVMRSVIYGIGIVLHEQFDPIAANKSIQNDNVTIASVVSIMLSRMLNDLDGTYPDQFRCMLLGGGPAPISILEKCKEKEIPVYQTYGMSETASQIVTLSPEDSLKKIGSAGKPLFPSQVKITDELGNELEAGQAGEIIVKGPNVTKGYYNRETATGKSIHNGWLKTGDIGYFDEEGFLYVLDRRKDLIISGGENIYPAEIEDCLLKHDAIAEAGVTRVEDDQWGSVPVAFIVPKDDKMVSAEDVQKHCKKYLAKYKIPKWIYFTDELPRNASNKLMRRKLNERLVKEDS